MNLSTFFSRFNEATETETTIYFQDQNINLESIGSKQKYFCNFLKSS